MTLLCRHERILTQGRPVPIAPLIAHYIIETHSKDFQRATTEMQYQRHFTELLSSRQRKCSLSISRSFGSTARIRL